VLAFNPDTVLRPFVVPIQYRNLPATLVLDETAPREAQLTLSGSEREFRFLEPTSLRVTIDLSQAQSGLHEFDLSTQNVRIPSNLRLEGIHPRVIRLFITAQHQPTQEDAVTTGRN
jgi:hypothetical protein